MRQLLPAVTLLLLVSTAGNAASFDCGKATTPDEITICGNPRLSQLDSIMATAYRQILVGNKTAVDPRPTARDFVKNRHACLTNSSCIMVLYLDVLNTFAAEGAEVALPIWANASAVANGDAPISKGLPQTVGGCVSTQVVSVAPRLGEDGRPIQDEDYDYGTAINYKNGGRQVSYSREPKLLAAHAGDQVVMCLVSIEENCRPTDNDPVRAYLVTHLSTNNTWVIADRIHGCRGA